MQRLYAHRNGTLIRHADFRSEQVAARHVDIWLPPGYRAGQTGRYPVIYMHDGQNLHLPETSYGNIPWSVDQAMVRLMKQHCYSGAIVVGVWNWGEHRWREYMPQKPMDTEAGQAFSRRHADRLKGALIGDRYLRFLVGEVKPFVDANYRTKSDQANTFVMGSSMGGLVSLYALTEYPEVFGGAGCVSTHWSAGEQILVDYFGQALPRAGKHRVYFDYGTETLDAAYEPFQLKMDEKMQAAGYTRGVDWITLKFPGAEHSEAAWRQRVDGVLWFLLGAGAK